MPLLKSPSKKAFSKNVATEMSAGKPQPQSLAIAYDMKRRNKKPKKMAEGGAISASDEKRPMPDERDNDSAMASRNSGDKAPSNDRVTDQPERRQSMQGMKTTPIKHPKMVPSDAFSSRLRDQEDDLQASADVNDGPQHQPPQEDNEMDADKSGPDVPALHMKRMAKGGMINKAVSMDSAEDDMVEHPAGLESDDDQMSPSEDEFMAGHFAEGGMIDDEEMLEHHSSMAAAIMARMEAKEREDSGAADMDKAIMAADGGILSHDSIHSDDSDQADLSRNADEDANEEDQTSFNALRKENYSESAGLRQLDQPEDSNEHGDSEEDEEENEHDSSIVDKIMRKKSKSSPISR